MIDARCSIIPDIPIIARNIRQADREEVWASHRMEPKQVLMDAYLASEAMTIIRVSDRAPLAMFGCAEDGCVWLLATDGLQFHRWEFLRKSQGWVDYYQSKHDLLYNVIDKRNRVHMRWLGWLGFRLIREVPEYGHLKLPFVEFARVRANGR